MGDMADFALDCACDDCEDYDLYQSGYYSLQESYDRGFINEMGRESFGPQGWATLFYTPTYKAKAFNLNKPKVQLKCNKCGSTDVEWKQYPSGKWFLFTDGKPHKCIKKENI